MPILPAMTLVSATVDPNEIYDFVFDPANPPASLEVLNGGLDQDNYTGADDTITPWMCQFGTFACGGYSGDNDWEWLYAKQLVTNTSAGLVHSNRVVMAKLSGEFYIPWSASFMYTWFQAFFAYDATLWDKNHAGGSNHVEYWNYQVYIDGVHTTRSSGRLSDGRSSVDLPATPHAEPGYMSESTNKFVSKPIMTKNLVTRRHTYEVTLWGHIYAPDHETCKLKCVTGGFGVIAVR